MSWKHPGKVAITFRDVAAYFTEVEWKRLQENQKEFYKKVMKEIHQTLIFLGYKIANPDTLVRITKGKEPHIWEANESGRRIYNNEPSSFCHRAVGPDIFLRIKEEPLCGAKSSDEELEVSSRPSKANNTSTNSSIIHWRKRAEKLSSCDFQDAKASEREAGLNSADADVSNAAVLPKIKREAKFPLKGCQDIEIGRSKAGHKAANYTSDSSNVQYMIKREKKPSGKGSEAAKSKTDLSKEILFVSTDICSGETEESNPFVVAQPDGKDAQHGTSPSSGYEVISFPIKEEEEDYPLNHPFFESRGRIAHSAGFGKRKAADSIHSHQDNLQEEESELYNDFESALSDSEILSFQLNTDQQCGLLYTCAECDKNFTSKESLMIHLRTHAVDKPYPCAKCDKSFSLKRNLKRHQRTHIEENERRYRCDECEKTFCQKDSLVKHKRTHTGERPYHCTECDKRFSVRVNLITHQRIHSSERPYQCTQCDKSFTQKAHLIGHEAKHTGVRPYQCSKCDKSYSFQGSLIRHQSSHTGNAGSTTAAKEKAPKKQQI